MILSTVNQISGNIIRCWWLQYAQLHDCFVKHGAKTIATSKCHSKNTQILTSWLQPPPPWFRLLTMMNLPCMSLAQDARYIYRKLLFAVVSAVSHFASQIFQENLSLKFLSTPAKSCSFPWPFAFQWLGWPPVNPRMTFMNNLRNLLIFVSVLNGYEYDNIRSCRKVLIILFGVMLSSVIIFDSAAPSWPWISRWAWQGQTVRDTRFIHCIYLSKY